MVDPTELRIIFSKVPYLGQPGEFGPFHRLQCPHVNELMCQSGLIGGGPSYGVGFTRVHAFTGPLPEHLGGLEFWTGIAPYPYSPPVDETGVRVVQISDAILFEDGSEAAPLAVYYRISDDGSTALIFDVKELPVRKVHVSKGTLASAIEAARAAHSGVAGGG